MGEEELSNQKGFKSFRAPFSLSVEVRRCCYWRLVRFAWHAVRELGEGEENRATMSYAYLFKYIIIGDTGENGIP